MHNSADMTPFFHKPNRQPRDGKEWTEDQILNSLFPHGMCVTTLGRTAASFRSLSSNRCLGTTANGMCRLLHRRW
jgi:hypothetical protein